MRKPEESPPVLQSFGMEWSIGPNGNRMTIEIFAQLHRQSHAQSQSYIKGNKHLQTEITKRQYTANNFPYLLRIAAS